MKPSWFSDDKVLVLNARTCGLNKDGHEQLKVDRETGARTSEIDDELSDLTKEVELGHLNGKSALYVPRSELIERNIAVPSYYDRTTVLALHEYISSHRDRFSSRTIGELVSEGELTVRKGHGSPSSDQRVGSIPYVKVSDLRAGLININPSNLIPRKLAEKFWGGESSNLLSYDIISPERASKNIGEFCVLMPGQENIVLTKEMLIFRGTSKRISQFYLMWAVSLDAVRKQWARIVFMQTNREDVGDRYLEIEIPYPLSDMVSENCARPFEHYFNSLAQAKANLRDQLSKQGDSFHLYFA